MNDPAAIASAQNITAGLKRDEPGGPGSRFCIPWEDFGAELRSSPAPGQFRLMRLKSSFPRRLEGTGKDSIDATAGLPGAKKTHRDGIRSGLVAVCIRLADGIVLSGDARHGDRASVS